MGPLFHGFQFALCDEWNAASSTSSLLLSAPHHLLGTTVGHLHATLTVRVAVAATCAPLEEQEGVPRSDCRRFRFKKIAPRDIFFSFVFPTSSLIMIMMMIMQISPYLYIDVDFLFLDFLRAAAAAVVIITKVSVLALGAYLNW